MFDSRSVRLAADKSRRVLHGMPWNWSEAPSLGSPEQHHFVLRGWRPDLVSRFRAEDMVCHRNFRPEIIKRHSEWDTGNYINNTMIYCHMLIKLPYFCHKVALKLAICWLEVPTLGQNVTKPVQVIIALKMEHNLGTTKRFIMGTTTQYPLHNEFDSNNNDNKRKT